MIYSLCGILAEKTEGAVVVECNGVGYLVSCSSNTLSSLPSVGEEVFLYTVFTIKENAVELAGFSTTEERDLFKMLCTVSGVGPKIAFSVLSSYVPDRLMILIGSGDSKAITSCPGVGSRLAQRIVVELKDKVAGFAIGNAVSQTEKGPQVSNFGEALAALVSLGYSSGEASKVLSTLDTSEPLEVLITQALRIFDRR